MASIRGGLTASQRCGFWGLAGALTTLAISSPPRLALVLTVLLSLLFASVIILRLASVILSIARARTPSTASPLSAAQPIVTVLVPLYREANMVPGLINALNGINYPSDRLDIKLLLEADDPATGAAVDSCDLSAAFEVLVLPPCTPRTKPKALNFGLTRARGEIVCIFDAEDRPSPEQVTQAVAAFENDNNNLAVVQAPLLTHNGATSWIAGQFQLEYAVHFLVWLPFLERLGLPIPLGGTSNYFARDRLDRAGGWDPWNVTEDADLGYRLARLGGRAAMISAPTMEEGPSRFHHWLAQRTRWMKGHIQTWLVLMREPARLIRQLGFFRFLGLQLSFGVSLLAAMAHLPLLLLVAFSLAHPAISLEHWHAGLFGIGYASVLSAVLATREVRLSFWKLVSLPLYWPLTSIAMYLALWEMKTRPHKWAKTPHGVGA